MIDSHKINYSKLDTLNVSRETFLELDEFKEMILDENKKINLISQHTEELARDRHIIDCAQIIDLIDENHLSCTDLGSGSGLPGLVLAIIKKKQKSKMKFFLYEKSYKKSNFLKKVINELNIHNVEIFGNIYSEKISTDIILCRAFKKLPKIMKISREIVKKPHKIIILKGRNADKEIKELSIEGNYSYRLEKSITDDDSKIILIEVE